MSENRLQRLSGLCIRTGYSGILGLCLAITACRSVSTDRHPLPPTVALSQAECRFATALAHYTQGLIYENTVGRGHVSTLVAFEKAYAQDTESHRLTSHTARALLQHQQPERALEYFRKACTYNPENAAAWADFGSASQLAGQTNDAIAAYNRSLKLDAMQTPVYTSLAGLYLSKHDDHAAVKVLLRGIKIPEVMPPIVAFCFDQGRLLVEQEQIERAIPLFLLMAEYAPAQRERFHLLVGELYESINRPDEAAQQYTKAIGLATSTPEAYLRLAELQEVQSPDSAHGIQTLQQGLKRFPDNPAILFAMAYTHHVQQEHENALPFLNTIIEQVKSSEGERLSAGFYLLHGSVLERMHRFNEAEMVFEECLSIYPNHHQALNYLAYMWAEQNRALELAERYVKRALDLDPDNGAYLDTLGWIFYRQGKYSEALEIIIKASEKLPNDATILEHLGDIHLARGDTKQAAEAWTTSLRLNADNKPLQLKMLDHGTPIPSH